MTTKTRVMAFDISICDHWFDNDLDIKVFYNTRSPKHDPPHLDVHAIELSMKESPMVPTADIISFAHCSKYHAMQRFLHTLSIIEATARDSRIIGRHERRSSPEPLFDTSAASAADLRSRP